MPGRLAGAHGTRGPRSWAGAAALALYRSAGRAWAKSFSLASAGAFASFGARSVLQPPIRIKGERRIAIGSDVFVGAGSWLQAIPGPGPDVAITIGDGTSIAGGCVLSATAGVTLGRKVLLARNVYIADHAHAFDDPARAVLDQGIADVRPVEIGDGAWLGQNVVVCPGVRIGRGAVIGANAVVRQDVPDHGVAVGVPARVVRIAAQPSAPDTTFPPSSHDGAQAPERATLSRHV
jgi:acetyltransferase-like isoleucine patch superfamily enzyme